MKLKDVIKQVKQGRKSRSGTICPCCTQHVQEYQRSVTSSMVRALSLMYVWYKKNDPKYQKWLHIENYLKDIPDLPSSVRGDAAKLRYWDLIQRKIDIRSDGSDRVGYYRLTKKGETFLMGKIAIQERAIIFNKKCIGFTTGKVKVHDCMDKHFSYNDLMKGIQ